MNGLGETVSLNPFDDETSLRVESFLDKRGRPLKLLAFKSKNFTPKKVWIFRGALANRPKDFVWMYGVTSPVPSIGIAYFSSAPQPISVIYSSF